jgi:hypothetical protein
MVVFKVITLVHELTRAGYPNNFVVSHSTLFFVCGCRFFWGGRSDTDRLAVKRREARKPPVDPAQRSLFFFFF